MEIKTLNNGLIDIHVGSDYKTSTTFLRIDKIIFNNNTFLAQCYTWKSSQEHHIACNRKTTLPHIKKVTFLSFSFLLID